MIIKIKYRILLLIIISLAFATETFAQFQISGNSNFYIANGATVKINANVNVFNATSKLTQVGSSFLEITGALTNNGTVLLGNGFYLGGDLVINNPIDFVTSSSTVTFNGPSSQTISCPSTTVTFYDAVVNKTGGNLYLNQEAVINHNLRLVSNALFDIGTFNLTIGILGNIYSDFTNGTAFSTTKCIFNSQGINSGKLIKKINPASPMPLAQIVFPLGTPGFPSNVYTPASISINDASLFLGAYLAVKAINNEHPKVETTNHSLTKYWQVSSGNLTINPDGADVLFNWNATEEKGNASAYYVLYFSPSYPNPAGFWIMNPGITNYADINVKNLYSTKVDSVNGDWTAGEDIAAFATYYSIANGNYNTPSTWSKVSYSGPASTTAPNKQSDKVKIKTFTVTVDSPIAPANLLSVEATGKIRFISDNPITGDTFRIADNAFIEIGGQYGIWNTLTGATGGVVQTKFRYFSPNIDYVYVDNPSAVYTQYYTGDAMPSPVRSLVVNKTDGKSIILGENLSIIDSLIIHAGTLDLDANYINGNSNGRTFTMFGGELVVRTSFPNNFLSPTFTSGTITFDGTGNATVPSSGSTPAVNQYNYLRIRGTRDPGKTITFQNLGDINLINDFDISSLVFSGAVSQRFIADGSTFIFKKAGGVQNIPTRPASPVNSIVNLAYYNLKISGSGTKQLFSSIPATTFTVTKDLTLESSTFDVNGFDLEVDNNWINTAGIFNPRTNTVNFFSPTITFSTYITSRSIVDNPFYNIKISGGGNVQPIDNLLINNNLVIAPTSNLILTNTILTLNGNWTNEGGIFVPGTSTVNITGTTPQLMNKYTTGNENFYNLIINNANGLNASGVGINLNDGVVIQNNLTLSHGNIITRTRHVTINPTATLSRPGGTPGHVDGPLRKTISFAGLNTFEVGYLTSYTPTSLTFTGSGGNAGMISVSSNTITTTTSLPEMPVTYNGAVLSPAGSGISDTKSVLRQWTVSVPSSSTFTLGASRQYNVIFTFINPPDLRGGANPLFFETRMWNGSTWLSPNRFGIPLTGTRTTTTTEYRQLTSTGTFILGEPSHYSYFSIASGNWTSTSSANTRWSTESYWGPPVSAASFEPTPNDYVYIGNSNIITLDAGKTTTSVVTIDSSGVLMCGTSVLSGSGTFSLTKDATLGIGDAAGITTVGGGNIQTTTRNYNPSNHNRGHFIYTNAAAATGVGLPSVVATLAVNLGTSPTVNLTNASTTVTDSCNIINGNLNGNAHTLALAGNWTINSTGNYVHGNGTVSFVGQGSQSFTGTADMTFYNMIVDNRTQFNQIIFAPTAVGNAHNININNNLTFAANNLAYINLSSTSTTVTGFPTYNNGEWFMTIVGAATVTRTGAGHIDGELRKNVPAGAIAVPIVWEIGVQTAYRPFTLDLNSSGADVAGYVGMQNIEILHPNIDDLTTPPYSYPPEGAFQMYWRMTRPSSSAFARGNRTMDVTIHYLSSDFPPAAQEYCFDLAFWKGGATTNWQHLTPNSTNYNDGTAINCGSRTVALSEATYIPNGTLTSTMAYNIANTRPLGNTDLGLPTNNRFLLGDFVGVQQGLVYTYYYSRQSGNWTDPNTWSTVSYTSAVNNGTPTDPGDNYPKRRRDIANIGNSATVTLDANIGIGYATSSVTTPEFFQQRLGGVNIEKTVGGAGYLKLGTHVIMVNGVRLFDGGFIETGAEDGFNPSLYRGNLISEGNVSSASRDYNVLNHNNGNYVFTAQGKIPTTYLQAGFVYCNPSPWTNTTGWITNVQVSNWPYSVPFFSNPTGQSSYGYRGYPDKSLNILPGQSYAVRVSMNQTYWCQLWIDFNYDGAFDNSGASTEKSTSVRVAGGYATLQIAVPAGTPPGSTRMRIQGSNGGNVAPCNANGTGEVEDYTINIVNPSYIVSQSTGGDVPAMISTLSVNTVNASSTVTQTSDIVVRDSMRIDNGIYTPKNQVLKLRGNFLNNASQLAFANGVEGTLTFDSSLTQTLKGAYPTAFYNLFMDKQSGTVQLAQNEIVNNLLTFNKDNYFAIKSYNLTFGPNALAISPGAGAFSGTRMILSEGSATIGSVQKQFTTVAGAKSYFFPIGVNTDYNPANINITGTYSGTPLIDLKLFNGQHPAKLSNNILSKYWRLSTSGITQLASPTNVLNFTYLPTDVHGNQTKYIAALYRAAPSNQWEVNLGTNPVATSSPITINNSLYLLGDWTAGEANSFYVGRIFYSLNTGNWNLPSNWSNIGHQGPPASYFPGQIYNRDTVLIDGNTITYNISTDLIDSLQIGGPSNTASALPGILLMGIAPVNKTLTIDRAIGNLTDGQFNSATSGACKDTLIINGNLNNVSAQPSGFKVYTDPNNYTVLQFSGSSSSTVTQSSNTISGNGIWSNLAPIVLSKKNGLMDSLLIGSTTFAAQSGIAPVYLYYPNNGVLTLSLPSSTFWLSSGAQDVQMQPFTGLNILNGAMRTSHNLITNVATTINVNGGNLYVGDAVDEHFLYKTGTYLTLNNGLIDVAGCFRRNSSGELINFSLNGTGIFRVMTQGNTDVNNYGFDISNSSSSFSMSGGTIIVASGTNGASADFKIVAGAGANGTGMIGGAIQTGHPSLPFFTPQYPIKISGTMPIWDLNATRTNVQTYITEQVFTIKNNLNIVDNSHTFSLNGNTLQLRGNLTNNGIYAEPVGTVIDPWQLVLDQAGTSQTITNNENGGLKVYRLRIDKNGGSVILDNTANSNLIIRNALEFSTNNTALLNSRTNNKFVEAFSNITGVYPQILRNGQGHVDGLLYIYYPTDNKAFDFPIGASTVGEYRPVNISVSGTGGTPGLIGSIASIADHSQITEPPIKLANYVHRYWTVSNSSGFALGANRNYQITTTFLVTDPPGATSNYEHFIYNPALPSTPPSSSWSQTRTTTRTATSVTSINNILFGDFVAGEPSGKTYWSYDNGTWNNTNTAIWSVDGYLTKTTPVTLVPGTSDIVYIGNSRTITVPGTYTPTVHSLFIEKTNGNPGALFIQGPLNNINTATFLLEDSCYLGMESLGGILADGSNGAIKCTSAPIYGKSHYIYNGTGGGQPSGNGLPGDILSLTVNNTSSPNNGVYISPDKFNSSGTFINIYNHITIINGTFNFGSRDIMLYGNMKLQNTSSTTNPTFKKFIFTGPSNHNLALENMAGVDYYDLELNGGDVLVTKNTASAASQVYVEDQFSLSSSAKIDVRTPDRKVILQNVPTVIRTGTGYVDGILQKPISTGNQTVNFEIGNGNNYTPATIVLTGIGGVLGPVDGVNITPVPHIPADISGGNRMDPVKSIPRYWSLSPSSGSFVMGNRTANVTLQFPAAEIGLINTAKAVVRRMSIPAEVPLWSERYGTDLTWNAGLASVTLSGSATLWPGLGEFYIGEKGSRAFYSVANGNWNNYLSWTFNANHLGATVPAGEYPNNLPSELNDNVEIGLTHIITQNANYTIGSLDVINDSKLDMQTYTLTGSSTFTINNNATLSSSNPTFPSNTLLGFITLGSIISPTSTMDFYANGQTVLPDPFALNQHYGNVLLRNGNKSVTSPVLVRGNLTNDVGVNLQVNNIDALMIRGSIFNCGSVNNLGVIEIGQ